MDEERATSAKSYHYKDLLPAEPLENLESASSFFILHHSSTKYNEFNLMAVDVSNDEHFQLNESIFDVADDSELKLGRLPSLKEIVLAKSPDDNKYHRAIVLKIGKGGQVRVYFFDVGGTVFVQVEDLKPVNEEIMQYPVLGYHVNLQDTHSAIKLLLRVDFEQLMSGLKNTKFSLQLGAIVSDGKKTFTEKQLVILKYRTDSGTTQILAEEINKRKIWEWELYSRGKGTDDDICENGSFGSGRNRRFNDRMVVADYNLEIGVKFTAQVTRVSREENNSTDEALVRVVLLDDPLYLNYFNVLHDQIKRYTTMISQSRFYPAINEWTLFKLEDKEAYAKIGVKLLGRWCRAVRIESNMIYLVDLDDYIVMDGIPAEDYDYRRLYGEFIKIPVLTISIVPKEKGNSIPLDRARELFKQNMRYAFDITKVRDDGTYEAEFGPASQNAGS